MMKRTLLISALSLLCATASHIHASSLDLHEATKQANTQLESVISNLEYTVQIVNQGAYQESNKKRTVRVWILDQLTQLRSIQDRFASINEESLMGLVSHSRSFLMHFYEAAENDFNTLSPFTPPVVDGTSAKNNEQFYLKIQEYLDANQKIIDSLGEKISSLGLSSTNRFVRYLDRLNTDYQLATRFKNATKFAGFAALGLYLLPYEKVKSIPGIGTLKRFLGTPAIIDPKGSEEIKAYPNAPAENNNPQPNRTLSDLINSNERYMFGALLTFATMTYNRGILDSYFEPVGNYLSETWNTLKGFRPEKANGLKRPSFTLDDPSLIGLESQIAQMREVVRYVTEPEKYDRSASGLEKGILLTGPSGSGKTTLIEATCGSINEAMQKKGIAHRFAIQEVNVNDIYAHQGGIKALVKKAKEHAPCILWIDEIHNLMLQTKEGGQTLNEFLTMQDELRAHGLGDTVILIAATNRPYALDDALLKPGRFGIQIHFENPSFIQRKKYFVAQCQKNALDPQTLDVEGLARQMGECSYGELKMVFNKARFTALQQGRGIKKEDFQKAIEQDIYRLRDENDLPLTPQARTLVATHQAGHAFMTVLHEEATHERLELVTLKGRWNKIIEKRIYLDTSFLNEHHKRKITYGHIFISQPSEMVPLAVDPIVRAKILVSGLIAEEVLLGVNAHDYRAENMHEALKELEKITLKGLPESDFAPQELIAPKQEAKRLLAQCVQDVRTTLEKNKAVVAQLADELLREILVRGDAVKKIVANALK